MSSRWPWRARQLSVKIDEAGAGDVAGPVPVLVGAIWQRPSDIEEAQSGVVDLGQQPFGFDH
jgi:hypothetical protein